MVARALTRKGTALVKMAKCSKDYKPAIETFQKALTEHCNPDTLKRLTDAEKAKKELEQQEYFNPQLADEEREKGNQFFKEQKYPEAIKHYTESLKRNPKDPRVYGNNVEIQAMSEMYNRPIHIYSYSTEPINIFHGSYTTDTPPVRLSYHHGNYYNSLVDPRRLTVGAGLGFSSLRGVPTKVDKDQVKAAIRALQEQQIDNAVLAKGHYYADLELTEKEIERMVMEASRFEYLANDRFKQQLGHRESSTSRAEPSFSRAELEIMSKTLGREGRSIYGVGHDWKPPNHLQHRKRVVAILMSLTTIKMMMMILIMS